MRSYRGQETLDRFDFQDLMEEKIALLKMPEDLLTRSVNVGFSGGEKKRNDILQMAVLEPELCILDESDSGLDIDAVSYTHLDVYKRQVQKGRWPLLPKRDWILRACLKYAVW